MVGYPPRTNLNENRSFVASLSLKVLVSHPKPLVMIEDIGPVYEVINNAPAFKLSLLFKIFNRPDPRNQRLSVILDMLIVLMKKFDLFFPRSLCRLTSIFRHILNKIYNS